MGRIDFLGTGNAFTPFGRLHALALIDQKIMIDTPPSLIPQLRKYGISTSKISHLLFTHWHADHTFGFPFFLLERKYKDINFLIINIVLIVNWNWYLII